MAKFISAKLANLIRSRCRVKARINKLEARIDSIKQQLSNLERLQDGRLRKLERLDDEIRSLAPTINPNEIAAQKYSKRPHWPHGAFNAALVRFLKAAPNGLSTTELMVYTANELKITLTPITNYVYHRERVRRQLSFWASKGYVLRLHDVNAKGVEGRWRILGPGPILELNSPSPK